MRTGNAPPIDTLTCPARRTGEVAFRSSATDPPAAARVRPSRAAVSRAISDFSASGLCSKCAATARETGERSPSMYLRRSAIASLTRSSVASRRLTAPRLGSVGDTNGSAMRNSASAPFRSWSMPASRLARIACAWPKSGSSRSAVSMSCFACAWAASAGSPSSAAFACSRRCKASHQQACVYFESSAARCRRPGAQRRAWHRLRRRLACCRGPGMTNCGQSP